MFQFTSTTVINSDKDSSGLKLFTHSGTTFMVRRGLNFKKANVVDINFHEHEADNVPVAEVKLTSHGAGTYRLALYIKLSQDSANSYYSNDLVFKGKPLYAEFVWKEAEEATVVAKRLVDTIKKYMVAVYEKELITAELKSEIENTTIVIKGTDVHQRFVKVDIEKYTEDTNTPLPGRFIAVDSFAEGSDGFVQGNEGRGTYWQVLKNLRLPTAARTSWTAINSDEAPIMGAQYDQFTIRYCTDRGVMGGNAVGEVTKSMTTHVFYVNTALSANFKSEIEASIGTVTNFPE